MQSFAQVAQLIGLTQEQLPKGERYEIQKFTRNYYKQIYAFKMDNLEEMDKFLERRLNQEETENMNRPITSTKIEPTIQKLPNKSP